MSGTARASRSATNNRIPHAARAQHTADAARAAQRAAPASVEHAAPPGAAELIAAFRAARGIDPVAQAALHAARELRRGRRDRVAAVLRQGPAADRQAAIAAAPATSTTRCRCATPPTSSACSRGDVTGDGRRELFVRVKQMVGDVQREILLGYTFTRRRHRADSGARSPARAGRRQHWQRGRAGARAGPLGAAHLGRRARTAGTRAAIRSSPKRPTPTRRCCCRGAATRNATAGTDRSSWRSARQLPVRAVT